MLKLDPNESLTIPAQEFIAVCFCAEWCGACREYQPAFEALQSEFPDIAFVWVDVEDNASWAGDFEVENFPTILIQRDESVLFYGVMLPHQSHLRRMLEVFQAQSLEQSHEYAQGTDERRGWQERHNFREALRSK